MKSLEMAERIRRDAQTAEDRDRAHQLEIEIEALRLVELVIKHHNLEESGFLFRVAATFCERRAGHYSARRWGKEARK